MKRKQYQEPRQILEKVWKSYIHNKAASTKSESRLHQLRVASRRLEALLSILARKKSKEAANTIILELRTTRKATSPLRDSQVVLKLLKSESEKIPNLTKFIETTRNKARENSEKISLNENNNLIKSILIKKNSAKLKRKIQKSSKQTIQKIRASLASISGIKTKKIHKLRIQAKNLRYREEMADLIFGIPDSNIHELKILQDKLGGIHDKLILLKKIDSYSHKNKLNRMSRKIRSLKRHIQLGKRKELKQVKQLVEKHL